MKVILIITLIIINLSIISAPLVNNPKLQTLGTFQKDSNINLIQNCINSTYSNISRVVSPNGTLIINSQTIMTKNGFDYNYSFSNTSKLGEYIVYGTCDENGTPVNWVYNFFITSTGYQVDTGKSIIMILGLIVLLIVTIGMFYFGYNLENITIKVFSIGLSIVLLIFSIGYALTVLNSTIAEFSGITNIINVIYTLGVILLTTCGIGLIVWLIYVTFEMFSKYRGFRD